MKTSFLYSTVIVIIISSKIGMENLISEVVNEGISTESLPIVIAATAVASAITATLSGIPLETAVPESQQTAADLYTEASTTIPGLRITVFPTEILSGHTIYSPIFSLLVDYFPWFAYYLLSLVIGWLSTGTFYTITATITLDFYGILWLIALFSTILYFVLRYRYWNKYSRLDPLTSTPTDAFDLQPEIVADSDDRQGYPDEFMNAFLSSIKVFGYLDKPVFLEVAL